MSSYPESEWTFTSAGWDAQNNSSHFKLFLSIIEKRLVVCSVGTLHLPARLHPLLLLWLSYASLAEPSIAASEHVTLPVEGESLTLQCNLTSPHSTVQESFWMKNGEEIPETRDSSKNTEYRSAFFTSLRGRGV